jgi:peroxiredoxin
VVITDHWPLLATSQKRTIVQTTDATSRVDAKLREGKTVPLFYLPAAEGGEGGPAKLRSKYNMVLLFLEGGAESEAYLHSLASLYPDIESAPARVIVAIAQPLEAVRELAWRERLPFMLLADEGGAKTASLLGGAGAALCVADRYGTISYIEIKLQAAELAVPKVILEWLEYVEMLCPE